MIDIWTNVLDYVKNKYSEGIYSQLFGEQTKVLSNKDGLITVLVPNNLAKERINRQYIDDLESFSTSLVSSPIRYKFISPQDVEETNRQTMNRDGMLDRNNTFSNYIVGPSNRFAYISAVKAATQPGQLAQTLYIFGGTGLGKTHLLHAIGNTFQDNNIGKKVIFVKASTYVEEYVFATRSIDKEVIAKFKENYRNADLLLIDDIQMISNAKVSQNEFFSLFDHLLVNNKQIVMTSDCPAHQLTELTSRLRSRFESAISADITAPDYQLRLDILKYKLQTELLSCMEIGDDVLGFIASNFTSNIRELEGALKKLVFYCQCLNLVPTIDVAKESLNAQLKNVKMVDNLNSTNYIKLQEAIAGFYQISVAQLIGTNRKREYIRARHLAMYMLKRNYDLPYKTIGRLFSDRDHSTVISAIENVEKEVARDPSLRETIELINHKMNTIAH
jgi:chromosomal replication initiator protein